MNFEGTHHDSRQVQGYERSSGTDTKLPSENVTLKVRQQPRQALLATIKKERSAKTQRQQTQEHRLIV